MRPGPSSGRNNGFTLPELMVTILIGIGLMAGMAMMFGKFSQGLEFTRGFHTQVQKVERFREDFTNAVRSYPLPLGQSGSVVDIAEFGFEAQAFTNAAGNAGFLVGAAKESGTGIVVGTRMPYAKYRPVIFQLASADIAAIRASGFSAFLASLDASKGVSYPDVMLTRLLTTDSGNGGVRVDVSYLAKYDEGLAGKSFVLAKSEAGYDTNSATFRSPAESPSAWDPRGCFSNTQTINGRPYAVPLMANFASAGVETRSSIANGNVTYRQSFVCKDGVSSPDGAEIVSSASCDQNFVWNGTSCAVNSSRNSACAGLPAHASWNTVSSIGQAWDGANWIPSATGSYNAVASASECRFVCNPGYSWDGTTCGLSCDVPSSDTYNSRAYAIGTLTKIGHGQTDVRAGYSFFGAPPLDGNLLASFTYACNDGTATRISASNGNGSCGTNFTFNGSWAAPACVANTRTFACAAKPAVGTNWNTVPSYSQTWSGSLSTWLPADSTTAYNAAASSTDCRYACSGGYGWDGATCGLNCSASGSVVNGHPYSVPAQNHGALTSVDSTVAIANGSRTFRQAYSCSNGNVALSGTESNPANNCNANYAWSGTGCVYAVFTAQVQNDGSPTCGWGTNYASGTVVNGVPTISLWRTGYEGFGPVTTAGWSTSFNYPNGGCSMIWSAQITSFVDGSGNTKYSISLTASNYGGWGLAGPTYNTCSPASCVLQ